MNRLWSIASFPRLIASWSIGNFADSALFLTLAVWAKDLTGSSGAAAMVFFCLGAPVLASPVFGLLADRMRRKPLLVAANVVAAAAVLTLMVVQRPADAWLLFAVTVVYGALGCVYSAAQSGLLSSMVPGELLGEANGVLLTISQGLRIITPLAGAGLYALWGGHLLALGVAALLLLSAAGLATVRADEPRRSAGSAPAGNDFGWRALAAGFAHLRACRDLLVIVSGLALALGVIGLFDALLFAVVEHQLHRPPEFFGVLMSAQGAGSIIGGLTASRLLARVGPVRTVAVALGVFAGSASVLPVGNVPIVVVSLAVWGIAIPWAFVAVATTRQRRTPDHLQGRTAAATSMTLQLPQLVSTATGAALVGAVDFRILCYLAIGVIAAAGLLVWRQRASAFPVVDIGVAVAGPPPGPVEVAVPILEFDADTPQPTGQRGSVSLGAG